MEHMFQTIRSFVARNKYKLAVFGLLATASLICLVLVGARIAVSDSGAYASLIWNLFLAWIPFALAYAAYTLSWTRRWLYFVIPITAFLWLIFFPNAPYILTDIIHLTQRGSMPLWYDLITVITFAWTGTFLGLISLYLVQTLVRQAVGKPAGWLFALMVLALGSFGVYLGRFPRWNSWDVLVDPLSLFADIWDRLRHPFAYHQTYTFSLVFTLFLIAVYLMLVALVQFSGAHEDRITDKESH